MIKTEIDGAVALTSHAETQSSLSELLDRISRLRIVVGRSKQLLGLCESYALKNMGSTPDSAIAKMEVGRVVVKSLDKRLVKIDKLLNKRRRSTFICIEKVLRKELTINSSGGTIAGSVSNFFFEPGTTLEEVSEMLRELIYSIFEDLPNIHEDSRMINRFVAVARIPAKGDKFAEQK